MSILISTDALAARQAIVAGPLAPLAASLAGDVVPLLGRELYIPTEKALLSREGGRCPRDGTLLDFDPFEPHEHRCPLCGEVYRGELHDRFWIYWYQLWLAERAVHAVALAAVGAEDRFLPLARDILAGYAERYDRYPNVDNVLGPTRLFFSTYLESIWLLQICIAADLLGGRDASLVDTVRERIIAPSREIIAQYDEGGSNRQVWNEVALLASSLMLGDLAGARRAVSGPSGIVAQLTNGLLTDGTWYEGENYHLFAHRGLWYGVTMAENAGIALPAELVARFETGFRTPFASALPDFTLPSRRDSQYAISLRQWRIAEHCELGFARRTDPVLAGALARMYEPGHARHETGRRRSSADVERNARSSSLTRADLSWRALLFACAELPAADVVAPPSALLDAQGLAVFRRDEGRTYVSLDYGHSGGGHGHPDRLNVILAVDDVRWLDDFGTGSYVDPSLHWYRSTLAHNAPLFDGHSQLRVDGSLLAYDERGDAGWIHAVADEVATGVTAERTLVVMPSYVVDVISWDAESDVLFDLPLHAPLEIVAPSVVRKSEPLAGGEGTEDGFRFVRDTSVERVDAGADVSARASGGAPTLDLFASASPPTDWWRGVAPGAPGKGEHTFRIVRARGAVGDLRRGWSWRGDVVSAAWMNDRLVVALANGAVHTHRSSGQRWQIDVESADGARAIELAGAIVAPLDAPRKAEIAGRPSLRVPLDGRPLVLSLTESHYRRSEQSWAEAGEPAATVSIRWTGQSTEIDVDVLASERTFAPADATNIYDNEFADVNGDGVELFVETDDGLAGWMLVPELEPSDVRMRPIEGWTAPVSISAAWEPTASGYHMNISLPGDAPVRSLDVIVNEMPRGRLRRRGQLVLSGGAGEFVYLRGDRHEPHRLIPLDLTDV